MGILIRFVVWCAISAGIMTVIPMIKSKGFGANMVVAAVMSVLATVISILTIPVKMVALLVAFVPFLNIILLPLISFLFAWLTSTLALYGADKMIDGFEIKSITDTAIAALLLGIGQTIVGFVL